MASSSGTGVPSPALDMNPGLLNASFPGSLSLCVNGLAWAKTEGPIQLQRGHCTIMPDLKTWQQPKGTFRRGTVAKEDRSLMNVVFVTGDGDLDKKFVSDAKAEGMINLNGHRTVGGMRASIYNAMPKEGVEKLVAFMKKFEEENL